MTKRATLLPVALVLVVAVLAAIAIATGRSNAPTISGDATYPHHICTFREYCTTSGCTRNAGSFILYTAHEDGFPRLQLRGWSPHVTATMTRNAALFESRGGAIEGTLTLHPNRGFDITGTSGDGDIPDEHFGTGMCERMVGG
ncbi:MAG: hypothetical protein AAGL89_05955 [Pseudomonadota bacterium]